MLSPFTPLAAPLVMDEAMDDAALSPAEYARVLRDLARVNVVTMAARPTLGFLRAALARHGKPGVDRPWRILDVGFGDGDMLRRIDTWTRRRNCTAELVGIDLNPGSAAVAIGRSPSHIDFRTGDYAALAGEPWDFIVSSLVAHHMTAYQRIDFIKFMEENARIGWMVNDLHRHRVAFAGYPALAALMGVHPIVRSDGQISVGRSFRPEEWRTMLQDAAIGEAEIQRWFPYRLCVARLR